MNERDRRLVNLRWYCTHAIEAARLQRQRVLRTEALRYDLDFYLLCVWRLYELARQAGKLKVADATTLQNEMRQRWPLLDEVRNWWTHAKKIEWTSWFSDGIYRLHPDGTAVPVIDVEDDHQEVEAFYERLCAALPPLPDADDSD